MQKTNLLVKLLIAIFISAIIFIVRHYIITKTGLDLYDDLIFFAGLGGLRFLIREFLDSYILTMNAPGGGNNPNNPPVNAPVQGANANPPANTSLPYVAPVQDLQGIRQRPFINPATGQMYTTYQPYASDLAAHLDNIRGLNGGRATPVYNTHINAVDRHWLEYYYVGIGRNPSIAQNGVNLSNTLRRLP